MDWRAVMEHAYDLGGPFHDWLQGLVDVTADELDAGLGTVAYVFELGADGDISVGDLVVHGGPPNALEVAREVNVNGPPEFMARMVFAASSVPNIRAAFPDEIDYIESYLEGTGVKDAFGLSCLARSQKGVLLTAPQPEPMTPTRRQVTLRERLAAHIGAGFRLRCAIEESSLEGPTVEAVLDPSGHVKHAGGPARDAREALQDAVRRIDRLRAAEDDAEEALEAWQGLVDGRWSLVDHIDTDGRRFVVAHRNEPGSEDPRGLTERERQIAEYFGLGRTSKDIAYTLGVSSTYVDNVIGRVMSKLGLSGRAQMAYFFSPLGTRRTIKLFHAGEEELALGSLSPSRAALDALSETDRDIVERLLRGSTNEAIAAARGVSPATVATQIQNVYQRLDVGSRAELALRLLGPSPIRERGSAES